MSLNRSPFEDYVKGVKQELKQALNTQDNLEEAMKVYKKYKSLDKPIKNQKLKEVFYNSGIAYEPTEFDQKLYNSIIGNDEEEDSEIDPETWILWLASSINSIHKSFQKIKLLVKPEIQKRDDEAVREEILRLASYIRARQMSKKELLKAINPFLLQHPTTLSPEEMHDLYRRNYTQQQTIKASKPIQGKKPKPTKNKSLKPIPVKRIEGSPWSSYMKTKSFKERHPVNEMKVEERRWDQGPNTFNLKKQRKYMKHMIAPRHTFIIDYFFPGRFMYLLAINVNTRKAFFSVPKEIYRVGSNWNVPSNPKANSTSAIESLKDLMAQTVVKGLIMDQEPAWQNDFHAFCNKNGIAWRHYIKNDIKDLIETNDKSRGNHSTLALIDRLCVTLRRMNYNMGGNLSIDPDQMRFLIDEYNASPHSTLSRLLNGIVSPNLVDANPKLEDEVVLRLLIENASVDMEEDFNPVGKKVRILNESSKMDKLKNKLLPGVWNVTGRKHGLFICEQGPYEIKVSRWMLIPLDQS